MTSIELKRILREGAVVLSIMIIMAAIAASAQHQKMYSAIILELLMLLYASYAGWSMFDRERQEGAVEYLLTMPVSRNRLFFIKLTPRILSVTLLLLLYLPAHYIFSFPSFFSRPHFTLVYITVFLVSLSFSLTCKNFILALFLTGFFCTGVIYTQSYLMPDSSESFRYLAGAALLLVFPAAFFFAFRTYDLRPLRYFHFRLIPPIVAVLLISLGIAALMQEDLWYQIYLTRGGDIFKVTCLRSHLIRQGETVYLDDTAGPLAEGDGFMYLQSRTHRDDKCRTTRIEYFIPKTLERQTIYRCEDNWSLAGSSSGDVAIMAGNSGYTLLFNRDENLFKILILEKFQVREIPLKFNAANGDLIFLLLHVTDNPRQFILQGRKHFYRAWEDGTTEQIPLSPQSFTIWKNRVLMLNNNGLAYYDFSNLATPLFLKPGGIRKIPRKFGTAIARIALYTDNDRIYSFDMETASITALPFSQRPFYYEKNENGLHVLWKTGQQVSYGHMPPGAATTTTGGTLTLDFPGRITRIMPFPWGVAAYDEKGNYKTLLFSEAPHTHFPLTKRAPRR